MNSISVIARRVSAPVAMAAFVLASVTIAEARSTDDIDALLRIANVIVHPYAPSCVGTSPACVDHLGIVAPYALIGVSDGRNYNVAILARKTAGVWNVRKRGGGWLNVRDVRETAPDMSVAEAKLLERRAYRVWHRSATE